MYVGVVNGCVFGWGEWIWGWIGVGVEMMV